MAENQLQSPKRGEEERKPSIQSEQKHPVAIFRTGGFRKRCKGEQEAGCRSGQSSGTGRKKRPERGTAAPASCSRAAAWGGGDAVSFTLWSSSGGPREQGRRVCEAGTEGGREMLTQRQAAFRRAVAWTPWRLDSGPRISKSTPKHFHIAPMAIRIFTHNTPYYFHLPPCLGSRLRIAIRLFTKYPLIFAYRVLRPPARTAPPHAAVRCGVYPFVDCHRRVIVPSSTIFSVSMDWTRS